MLEKILKKSTVTNIILSFIFIIIAILLISKPDAMQSAITIILGIIAIAAGILKLISYAQDDIKDGVLLSTGIILIIGGFILMFFGETLQSLFKLIIAAWIIYSAIMDMITIFKWNKDRNASWYTSLVISVVLLIAGLWILFSKNVLIKTIGIALLIYGILDAVENIIFMISLDRAKLN